MPLRVGLRSSVLREVRLFPDAGRPRPVPVRAPGPPRARWERRGCPIRSATRGDHSGSHDPHREPPNDRSSSHDRDAGAGSTRRPTARPGVPGRRLRGRRVGPTRAAATGPARPERMNPPAHASGGHVTPLRSRTAGPRPGFHSRCAPSIPVGPRSGTARCRAVRSTTVRFARRCRPSNVRRDRLRPRPRPGARQGGPRIDFVCLAVLRRGLRRGSSARSPVVGGASRYRAALQRDDARLDGRASSSKEPATTYSPRRSTSSTIGAGGLNCRVRNGNGCDPAAMVTGYLSVSAVAPRTP